MQINHITKQPYTRQNAQILEQTKVSRGLYSCEWLTFLQAKEQGLKIKKGSKAVHLARVFDTDNTDTAGQLKKAIKHFCVFNLSDTEKTK